MDTADDGTRVRCRGRLDHLSKSRERVYDLKFCDDARPDDPGADPEPFDPDDKTSFAGVPVVITQVPVPFAPAPGTPGTWSWPPRV